MSDPLKYDYNSSLTAWHQILKDEPDSRKRAERMLKEGIKEVGKGMIMFDPILTCEALGEAERADSSELQAEAYKRIGMLWGKQYPALSLSIWRKAEKYYKDSGLTLELDFLNLNLSLSCFLTGEKYAVTDVDIANKFREEAGRIIKNVDEPHTDASSEASFRYTIGTILGDSSLLRQARSFYEHEGIWSSAIQCLDEEIRILIDSGNNQQALPLMSLVKEYALKDGDVHFANIVDESIAHVNQLKNGPRIKPLDVNNLTVLDVLDILAFQEERVIFSDMYKAGKITTGYEPQEGRFMALSNGRLMPTFRESWRLYRGESVFHADCKPTLWRKGMDDKTRFVERMKFVEFEQALQKMPEYKCFCSGFPIQDPTGRLYHVTPSIDALGMAQHYGVKTEMMDLTSDKWVAAFFACTKHNDDDDTYSPIVDETTEQGVIYSLPVHEKIADELSVVGAQPFERPTAQAAFMIKMKPDDDFNKISAEHVFFKQSPIISLIVYHYANRCNRLFPDELIQKKTWKMVNQRNLVFSPETMQKARELFKDEMDDVRFLNVQKEINIGDSGLCNMPVSEEEQLVTPEHWNRHKHLISKIDSVWCLNYDFKNNVII